MRKIRLCACGCGLPAAVTFDSRTGKRRRFRAGHGRTKGDAALALTAEERQLVEAEIDSFGGVCGDVSLSAFLRAWRRSHTLREIIFSRGAAGARSGRSGSQQAATAREVTGAGS
jgi:hypothetical protein